VLTRGQKALVHVAKNQLGLDDDLYREILMQEAGVSSASELDYKGFERVMKRFRKLGFRRKRTQPAERPQPGGTITPRQQAKIAELYAALGWTDPRRQMGFSRRVCGVPWPQTRAQANKVIEALKQMVARGYSERTGRGAAEDR